MWATALFAAETQSPPLARTAPDVGTGNGLSKQVPKPARRVRFVTERVARHSVTSVVGEGNTILALAVTERHLAMMFFAGPAMGRRKSVTLLLYVR